jgi:hypothetical protein
MLHIKPCYVIMHYNGTLTNVKICYKLFQKPQFRGKLKYDPIQLHVHTLPYRLIVSV